MYYLFMKPYMTTQLININLSAYVHTFSSDSDKYSLRRKDECTLMKNYARTTLFKLRYFNRIVDMWTRRCYAVIFSILLHRMFVALLMSKPSKNSLSLTILLSCNSKELIFDFYLNRKRNKCWLAAYSCDLFTWQYTSAVTPLQ